MRILLDESIPAALISYLPGHEVRTTQQMGWAGLKNGQLLAHAVDTGFDAFVTADRNLPYQQNLGRFANGIVVIRVVNTRPETVIACAPEIIDVLSRLEPRFVAGVGTGPHSS